MMAASATASAPLAAGCKRLHGQRSASFDADASPPGVLRRRSGAQSSSWSSGDTLGALLDSGRPSFHGADSGSDDGRSSASTLSFEGGMRSAGEMSALFGSLFSVVDANGSPASSVSSSGQTVVKELLEEQAAASRRAVERAAKRDKRETDAWSPDEDILILKLSLIANYEVLTK
ncbi:hypothetical protein EMIHUDRAFT_234523 [Emiliania huxleyi CCMP1516]|uniref:Uncharacterized protein n=2 Tax=Emiliania huxleyi TaxID=2903 RepID=A0A0D3JZB2_EMIH1|nr:hypothetical protein EMIHUDRAFT_234523 [Emiliania huxleyi CCMP1516]EOD28847.1 hypothetical protein EMIHUDRAFT_234523 [Emiliania huxleyi CCMP1516]|eukprot:XP_005781276.1 hypothetical protein EMIHUDRAFT_234523 [Emiliania huxleyi CCMP1516]